MPGCGGDIRLISFITEPGPIRKILTHLGEPLEPPPGYPLAVFGGMLGVTLFGIFLTPVFFYTLLRRGRS